MKPVHQTQILKHHEPLGHIDYGPRKARLFNMRNSLNTFEDNDAVLKQLNKGRSPTLRHVSRTQRVNLDRHYDSINLNPMIQIKYTNTTQQWADILTKGSFAGDRWTQLTLLVNIMTFPRSNLSASSAVVNPSFSSIGKRARESFPASTSAKSKPVHCSAMIAIKINDKNADLDDHAIPPTDYRAGGDSERVELCQQGSQKSP